MINEKRHFQLNRAILNTSLWFFILSILWPTFKLYQKDSNLKTKYFYYCLLRSYFYPYS